MKTSPNLPAPMLRTILKSLIDSLLDFEKLEVVDNVSEYGFCMKRFLFVRMPTKCGEGPCYSSAISSWGSL